ncbi:MAG: hypothetical protein OEZ13_01160 [Spirochaetia bacterium]|nr:hypothetical protein [Spirochaetia bacterium]
MKYYKNIGRYVCAYLFFFVYPIYSEGALQTVVHTYSSGKVNSETGEPYSDLSARVEQSIFLDFGNRSLDGMSFHTNNKISYRTEKNGMLEQFYYNLYYAYFDRKEDKLHWQAGRIFSINSFSLTHYDGLNIEYEILKNLTIGAYGGFIVHDDYIENVEEKKRYNSFDYRTIFLDERGGDNIEGARVSYIDSEYGGYQLDYQIVQDSGKIAEHYISSNIDTTVFLNMFQFYSYVLFDFEEMLPASALSGLKILPENYLVFILEHEYYRPVFLSDSFWAKTFDPYDTNEGRFKTVTMIDDYFNISLSYGAIFYQVEKKKPAHSVQLLLNHYNLSKFNLKFLTEYVNSVLGDQLKSQFQLMRDFDYVIASFGGGMIFYQEDIDKKPLSSKGFFLDLGLKRKLYKVVELSLFAEAYNNFKYDFDLRGIFAVKYKF